MKIEVSNGELIDKLSILEIKSERIDSPDKLMNIRKELSILHLAASDILPHCQQQYIKLKLINEKLWNIEDRIRDLERNANFDKEFVQTAREVYINNDTRAEIKKEINLITGSELSEEKSYQKY
ncbi:MAG: DUF6165 family protein [Bacteroidota bacterium]|nr:DUF6165 family protein [Bacteroidota bacterium]